MVYCSRGGFWPPYLAFLAFCLGYCTLAGAIPSYIAPLSAGSGIPEIKAYLNGVRIRGGGCCSCYCTVPLLAARTLPASMNRPPCHAPEVSLPLRMRPLHIALPANRALPAPRQGSCVSHIMHPLSSLCSIYMPCQRHQCVHFLHGKSELHVPHVNWNAACMQSC